MPTHQGKTHTDILIGDGGDNIQVDSSMEFEATYGTSANFQYKMNNSSGADNEDSSYELKILDSTGGTLATFFAEYTCDPVTGTATQISSTRTNTFNPSPNGNSPASLPTAYETFVSRDWEVSAVKAGQTFAGFESSWKFASTVASGGSVSQTVNTQTDDKLEVTLVYSVGGSTITVVVTCVATATASSSSVRLSSPSVTDDIQS